MALPTNMTIPDGIIAPRLDGDELKAKDDLYSTEQTGALIYVTEVPNPSTIKTQNITAPGYYYFNGDIWVKFSSTNSVSVNVENGLTQDTNTIKLGGNLVEATIIETSANNTLSITGLQSVPQENVLMVSSDGTLSKSVLNQLKGTLDTTYYKQGTSQLLVAAGSTSDVPGVTVTHTVPSSVSSQTLTFTITGYASKSGAGVSGSGQGVFALFQDNVKISSAYVSVSTGDGSSVPLLNLPVPCVILRSVTLTPGTYTFNVKFSA